MSKRKIIFDISEAINFLNKNNCYSGIQRVIAMVLDEFQKIHQDENLWIGFFKETKQEYYGIKLSELKFNNWASPVATKKLLKKLNIIGASKLLEKYDGNFVKYYFHRTRFDVAALVHNKKLFINKGLNISDWNLFRHAKNLEVKIHKLKDVFLPNDILVLIDSTWKENYTNNYKKIKDKGVKIFTFVHDLIPLLTPQFVDGNSTRIFYNWLKNSTIYTDCYIVNSQYTSNDLKEFLQNEGCLTPIKTMPLVQVGIAKDLGNIMDEEKDENPLPKKIDNLVRMSMRCRTVLSENFILTFACNNNITEIFSLLLTWKRMLDNGLYDIPRIVLIIETNIDNELKHFLEKTRNLNGFLTIFTDTTVDEINIFFQKCLFVVDTTLKKSCLLNIEEAFLNQKVIIISDEIKLISSKDKELIEICNFSSIDEIQTILKSLIFDKNYRHKKEALIGIYQFRKNLFLCPKFLDNPISISKLICNPYVLHVGTIEVRKNIWRLVLGWKKLLESGKQNVPLLVLAGRKGWFNDKLWDLLDVTHNLNGHVIVLNKVSDEQLDMLYKKCLFTVMVSNYEGWGLPVGEALAYGKTAVVARQTSLPEVGMNLVEYCDPNSIDSIAASVEKLVYDVEYRVALEKKIQQTKLRNWTDVAHDLAEILQFNHL